VSELPALPRLRASTCGLAGKEEVAVVQVAAFSDSDDLFFTRYTSVTFFSFSICGKALKGTDER